MPGALSASECSRLRLKSILASQLREVPSCLNAGSFENARSKRFCTASSSPHGCGARDRPGGKATGDSAKAERLMLPDLRVGFSKSDTHHLCLIPKLSAVSRIVFPWRAHQNRHPRRQADRGIRIHNQPRITLGPFAEWLAEPSRRFVLFPL